jgi:hypothetical protein
MSSTKFVLYISEKVSYGLDNQDLILGRDREWIHFLCHHGQSTFGAHPASCLFSTGASLGGKAARVWSLPFTSIHCEG